MGFLRKIFIQKLNYRKLFYNYTINTSIIQQKLTSGNLNVFTDHEKLALLDFVLLASERKVIRRNWKGAFYGMFNLDFPGEQPLRVNFLPTHRLHGLHWWVVLRNK